MVIIKQAKFSYYFTAVSCGSHSEDSCADCPSGHGADWCNGECQWDYSLDECNLKDYAFVEIFDGSNDQSTQIAILSGNLGSFSISSTGNFLFVKFESDGNQNYGGFLATIHYGSNPYLNIK